MLMKWYSAKLVFAIEKESGKPVTEVEEKILLIEAFERSEAQEKARMRGVELQEEVANDSGNSLYWRFVQVVALDELGKLESGIEIACCIREMDSAQQTLAYYEYLGNQLAASCYN
ncbi:hypothetical protein MASR2M44_19130 [Bacteroidota bacterium]